MTQAVSNVLLFVASACPVADVAARCAALLAEDESWHLLIVDDRADDAAALHQDGSAFHHPRLTIVRRPRAIGQGSAHRLALLHAMRFGYRILVTLDGGTAFGVDQVRALLAAAGEADVVVGSRPPGGGGSAWVDDAVDWVGRKLVRATVDDCMSPFRVYRVDRLRGAGIEAIRSDGRVFHARSLRAVLDRRLTVRNAAIPADAPPASTFGSTCRKIGSALADILRLPIGAFRRPHMPGLPPAEAERCPFCDSPYLVERWAARRSGRPNAEAFRCTSMEHDNKPRVEQCLVCDLMFVPSWARPQGLDALYGDVVDHAYLKYADARRKTFSRLMDRLGPHLGKPGGALEIGSYCGLFLEAARSRGWTTTGIEPSRWASGYARDSLGLDVRTGMTEAVAPELGRDYDMVAMWDVLEHVSDPNQILAIANGKLRDGGILCLSTVDLSNWFPRITGQNWPWLMDMHLYYFTPTTFANYAAKAGFEIVHSETFSYYVSASYFAEKLSAVLPSAIGWLFDLLARLPLLARLYVLIAIGDSRLYVLRKRRAAN
ncbi:MAG: methyltransferase domain-containing protein [Alphaproteobacteria bacterium]|nr:methyltransferase domain-containing protein [Alphaproteobacteria bacterium]